MQERVHESKEKNQSQCERHQKSFQPIERERERERNMYTREREREEWKREITLDAWILA